MSETDRIRRRPPSRVGPIRSWAELAPGLLRGSATTQPSAGTPPPSDPRRDGPPADDPAGAVHLGYRVVEEHLRLGREAAAKFGAGRIGLGPLGPLASFQALNERLLRDGLLWLEYVAKLWSTFDPPLPGSGIKGNEPAAPPPAGAEASRRRGPVAPATGSQPAAIGGVQVAVSSRQPVEVTIDLRERSHDAALAVQDLRADGAAPAITGITLARDSSGRLSVSLRVPDTQPTGTYHGVIFDPSDGSACGTLSARVGGPLV